MDWSQIDRGLGGDDYLSKLVAERDQAEERIKQFLEIKEQNKKSARESPSSSAVTSSNQTLRNNDDENEAINMPAAAPMMLSDDGDSSDSNSTDEFAADSTNAEFIAKTKEKNILANILERLIYNVPVDDDEIQHFRDATHRLLRDRGNDDDSEPPKRKKKKKLKRKRESHPMENSGKKRNKETSQSPSATPSNNDLERHGLVTYTEHPLKIKIFNKRVDEGSTHAKLPRIDSSTAYHRAEPMLPATGIARNSGDGSGEEPIASTVSTDRQLKRIKNTDKHMYASNAKYQDACVLCDQITGHSAAVRHYANEHPEMEVYISRISERMMKLCTGKSNIVRAERMADGRYRAFCLFCETAQTDIDSVLVEHLANHTGELVSDRSMVVNAFACKLCNYIQIAPGHVEKHLREQHDITGDFLSTLCIPIKLLDMRAASGELKNNDPQMYLSNASLSRQCVLCTTKSTNLSAHYARCHPARENYVSRLSPAMMQIALKSTHVARTSINDQYETQCLFCEKIKCFPKAIWLSHLTSHSGELMYRCSSCHNLTSMRKADCCDNSTYQQILQIPYHKNALRGFACKLCNYVQFSGDNVRRHILENHPECLSIEEQCSAITFFAIEDSPVARSAMTNTTEIKNNNVNMYMTNPLQSKCVLCGDEPANLPLHYFDKHHGKENYLSRLSPSMIKTAVSYNPLLATQREDGLFTAACPFCSYEQSLSKIDWLSHVAVHTGEHVFQCRSCNSRGIRRQSNCCGNKQLVQIHFKHHQYQTALPGYACEACNYVQLTEAKVTVHTVENHAGTKVRHIPITFLKFAGDTEAPVSRQQIEKSRQQLDPRIELRVVVEKLVLPATTAALSAVSDEDNVATPRIVDDSAASIPAETGIVTIPVLYGADLSTDDSQAAIPAHCSSAQPIIRVKTERSESQPLESSAASTSSESNPSGVSLKPWTTSSASKTATIVEYLLHDAALFALFKCMADNCLFSTNERGIMSEHLQLHVQYQNTALSEAGIKCELESHQRIDYLECAYCCDYNATWAELVQHIVDTHQRSIFQCQYCFYRCIDAFAAVVHLRKYHSHREAVILTSMDGYDSQAFVDQMTDLMAKQMENVKPIICHEDQQQFFSIDHFIWHIQHEHKSSQFQCGFCDCQMNLNYLKAHLKCHKIGDFQCLYCPFSETNLERMNNHMADRHPDRLMFVGARYYRHDYTLEQWELSTSTIILNLADAIDTNTDTATIRFRPCELPADKLNAVNSLSLPVFNNTLRLDKIDRCQDTKSPLSRQMRECIRNYTPVSLHQFITLDDFKQKYENVSRGADYRRYGANRIPFIGEVKNEPLSFEEY